MRSLPGSDAAAPDWPPSLQERALAAELRELDRSFDLECADRWDAWEDTESADDSDPGAGTEVDDVEVIDEILGNGIDPWSLALLVGIDPESLLDPIDRVRYLQAMDSVQCYVAAGQQRALVAVAGATSSGDLRAERHVEHEVAIARRSTRGRAGRDIELARTLREEFRDTAAALERGEVGLEHAAALVAGTRHVASAQARAEVERRVLPAAASSSPARFRRHVAAAVCAIDAQDETRRRARARGDRQVWVRRVENGLGELVVIDEWSVVSGMFERISVLAKDLQRERRAERRTATAGQPDTVEPVDGDEPVVGDSAPGDEDRHDADDEPADEQWLDRTLDNCRADALSDLVLHDDDDEPDGDERDRDTDAPPDPAHPVGARDEGPPRPRRRRRPRIEGRLVIDLATLRGEADNPALLDGSPIPAPVGRRLARDITHWRRMVTDPVDGHLLDYGRRTYLPEPLRTYVLERDRTCRNPWCDQPASRCEMDHATEFPHGPSSATNTGPLCQDCHRIKTEDTAFLDHSAADGSATWRTAWGQTVPIPTTRYLDDGRTDHTTPGPTTRQPTTGRGGTRPGSIPGVLDRFADSPPRRTITPPDDPGDIPPF